MIEFIHPYSVCACVCLLLSLTPRTHVKDICCLIVIIPTNHTKRNLFSMPCLDLEYVTSPELLRCPASKAAIVTCKATFMFLK